MNPSSPPNHHQVWALHRPYSKDEESEGLDVTSMVRLDDSRSQSLEGVDHGGETQKGK